ncbi:thioredoxin family protein [Labilibaculum manganireducens]|uniref:Thioredoxin family protein n=1 Tax=Labilibaculum manganireducens TaxID=1940525 RepID=A0A2N3IEE8_9BACT|nr:thioredoxin family protein [Labilibaculum manganireducens]PKQ68692.1 thioredoxin family protein [Labilibaculum manganireducens]
MKKVLILGLFILAAMGIQAQGYQIGDKAKDFKLKNVDGKQISLADYKDAKGFIVIFTCNHCPYAVAYEDRIIEIDKKYKEKGFPVIAINPNDPELYESDSFDNMIVRAKEKRFTFPYLMDETQEVFKRFGATKTPHVFILSNNSEEYTVEYIGAIDNNYKDETQVTSTYVEDALDALLQNKKPEITSTKAIGCGIKTKG